MISNGIDDDRMENTQHKNSHAKPSPVTGNARPSQHCLPMPGVGGWIITWIPSSWAHSEAWLPNLVILREDYVIVLTLGMQQKGVAVCSDMTTCGSS